MNTDDTRTPAHPNANGAQLLRQIAEESTALSEAVDRLDRVAAARRPVAELTEEQRLDQLEASMVATRDALEVMLALVEERNERLAAQQ